MYREIAAAIDRRPDAVAIEADEGRQYRYGDLDEWSARYASFLCASGLGRGDRVAVQAEKTPQSLFLYLACLRAGLIYVPLNTAYQAGELEHFLRDAAPALAVCSPQSEASWRNLAAATCNARVFTLGDDGTGSFAELAASADTRFESAEAEGDVAALIYTSGTTGRSKGAMITHRNLVCNARALVSTWGFSPQDVLLHTLPIFHVHGLFVANHCALASGARLLWRRRFEPQAAMRDLPDATVFMGVPTYYTRLLARPAFGREHCRNVRLFVSGSAPLLADTYREFESRTGQRILERYGMSEAGMITSNPLHGLRRPGTVGLPLPGVSVRVADERDKPLPPGEVGAIQVKGENVFKGYWRMPEKTGEEFTADGWFRTGDLGAFDADGYLSIVGRAQDLIISGGYNVYPKEVELALDQLPGVQESAVIGVPHADFGEAVTAIVVATKDAALTEAAILAALRPQLANYKLPKRVHIVEELPRNAMGKVQKNLLRERYGGT
ncbi:MAG: malonate--CoA ligase [Burkholderiales bacterium]